MKRKRVEAWATVSDDGKWAWFELSRWAAKAHLDRERKGNCCEGRFRIVHLVEADPAREAVVRAAEARIAKLESALQQVREAAQRALSDIPSTDALIGTADPEVQERLEYARNTLLDALAAAEEALR